MWSDQSAVDQTDTMWLYGVYILLSTHCSCKKGEKVTTPLCIDILTRPSKKTPIRYRVSDRPWPIPPLYHRTTPVFKLYVLDILIVHGGGQFYCVIWSVIILNHEFCTYRRRRRRVCDIGLGVRYRVNDISLEQSLIMHIQNTCILI